MFASDESHAWSKALLILAMCLSNEAFAATTIPSSTTTVNLQTLSSTDTSFVLPATGTIRTLQGDGIDADASRSWELLIQGVVNAADIGVNLAGNNNSLVNSGTIGSNGGIAILLNGAGNLITLDSGSVINGSIFSSGYRNALVLQGKGSIGGSIGGSNGFDTIDVVNDSWVLEDSVLLSDASDALLTIGKGSALTLPGTLSSKNNQTATALIESGGLLQIGNGGASGEIHFPIINEGVLAFFRSDTVYELSTPISGNGILLLKGTEVSGESSYLLNSDNPAFTGNVIIGKGARLHVNNTNPAPKAHVLVLDGGTLWLGSTANFTTPILLEGNGWDESGGPYGSLRLDSSAIQAGSVELTGNARITAIFDNYSGTISGQISDGGKGYQIEKYGNGLITLSGDNTWSGGMLLSQGRLSVSADSNLGASSGTLIFNGGLLEMTGDFVSQRALAVNAPGGAIFSTGTNTFAGGSSGSGPLTLGSGTLILAGNDTRTGNTIVYADSHLQIGSNDVNNAAQGTLSGNVLNNGTLTFNRSGESSYSGVLEGSGALIKQNSGLVDLTGAGSSQGSVTVNGGTLRFSPAGTFNIAGTLITAVGAQTSVSAGSQLNIQGAMTQQAGAALETSVDASQPAAIAPTIALNGALKVSGAPVSASSITAKTLTILHSTNASGISGDFSSLGFSNPADYLIVNGSKTNNDQDYNLGFGLTWFAGPVQGNGNFTLINPSDTFDMDIALTNQTPPFSSGWDGETLTKAGAGTLILSQPNTYTGSTLVNGGTLQTNAQDAFASSGNVVVNSGATLNLNNFNQQANNLSGGGVVSLGNAALTVTNNSDSQFTGNISGSGSLIKNGAQALTLSGNNTFNGGLAINAGTLIATSGAALGAGAVVNDTVLTLAFTTKSLVKNLLSGGGTLNKEGSGWAQLLKTGSSAGRVNVNSGVLNFGEGVTFTSNGDFNTAAGAVTRIDNGGALNVVNRFDLKGELAVVPGEVEPVVTANTVLLDSQSMLNIAGLTTSDELPEAQRFLQSFKVISTAAPGGISGDFSELHIGGSASPVDYATLTGYKDLLSQHYNVDIRLNWYAQHSSTPEIANGVFTLADAGESFRLGTLLIDQKPSPATAWDGKTLTKAGQGTLILAKHNQFTGPTLINGGTLQTAIDNALALSSEVNIASGATFALDGFDQNVNRISGNGDITLGDAQLSVNNNSGAVFGGTISGSGGLIKNGAGDLQLLANQAWTGSTAINSGSLTLGASPAAAVNLSSSQVNIASGSMLGGYGSIAGNVSNQGTIAVADAAPQFSEGAAGNLVIGGDLINAGQIIMASPVPASSLIINGNYQGNDGLLTLSTVLGDDNSATDKLIILGNSSGSTQVKINNAGGAGGATVNGIEIIHVAGQSNGIFTLNGRVVAGAYDYFLHQGLPGTPNGNWYLRSQLPEPPPNPPAPQPEIVRPEAGSYLANKSAASNMFTQRLEDRAGRAEDSTFWLRQIGTHTGAYDGSGQLKTTANSYMIQGGGELAQGSFFTDDRLGVGIMFGYGNAHSHTDSNRSGYSSKGSVDGYSSGVYGTWYQNAKSLEGTYVDSWLQYSWFKAQVKGDDLETENYHLNGFSGSLETGYRMGIYQGENSRVFLTPQAQIIWDGLQADSHTENNGTHVTYPDGNNLQSRLGLKLSRDGVSTKDKPSGKLFTTYVEANWLHNSDPATVALDDEKVGLSGTRNVGELKLGIEGKLSARLNVWGNVAQQMGGSGYSATSGVIGVDYRF